MLHMKTVETILQSNIDLQIDQMLIVEPFLEPLSYDLNKVREIKDAMYWVIMKAQNRLSVLTWGA